MARKSEIPDPFLVREFIDGLYHPEFIPEDVDLNNFLIETEADEIVRQSLESKKLPAATLQPDAQSFSGVPIPLTEAEAREADRQIEATLQRITDTREKIDLVRSKIDQAVKPTGSDGNELSFKMDISRKKSLRRAIKRLFGIKTDTITYSMYKEMLVAKKTLETQQGEAYANGFPEDTEEDKSKSKKDKKSDSDDNQKKEKKKKKDKGFLERNANQDEMDDTSQNEEQYERMFPKIGRDFIYKEDFYNAIDGIMNIIDPAGLNPLVSNVRSDAEARKRAREYKDVLDSGKDGSEIYKDLIKLDDEDEEEEL